MSNEDGNFNGRMENGRVRGCNVLIGDVAAFHLVCEVRAAPRG